MRVFVLSTGRCGSTTFAKACSHIRNFTVGHETRRGRIGADRLAYPDWHIEVDNRLSWHLGELASRYPDALYVHLTRDPSAVAASFLRRWTWHPSESGPFPGGIIEGYAYSIAGRYGRSWAPTDRLAVCHAYVATVNENIREFLRCREHFTIPIEAPAEGFEALWVAVGARGDLSMAVEEFDTAYNAS